MFKRYNGWVMLCVDITVVKPRFSQAVCVESSVFLGSKTVTNADVKEEITEKTIKKDQNVL
jgi:hypothetical protein